MADSPRPSLAMFTTPKWWLSHAFVLTMIVAMTAAGFWQLDRLDERRARNDDIRAASQADPAPVEELLARVDGGEDVLDHTAVIVEGRFDQSFQLLIANRTFDTEPGFWLVAPVELDDGSLVMVSRGWIPRDVASGESEQQITPVPDRVEITGRLFESVGGGRIGQSDGPFPQLSRLDLERVEEALGIEVADRWVQAEDPAWQRGEVPIPVPPPLLDEGPHLSYAFQWFFFVTGTVVAYTLILRRRLRDADNDSTDEWAATNY